MLAIHPHIGHLHSAFKFDKNLLRFPTFVHLEATPVPTDALEIAHTTRVLRLQAYGMRNVHDLPSAIGKRRITEALLWVWIVDAAKSPPLIEVKRTSSRCALRILVFARRPRRTRIPDKGRRTD